MVWFQAKATWDMDIAETNPELTAAILDSLSLGVMLLRPVGREDEGVDFEWHMMNRSALGLLSPQTALIGKRLLDVAPHLQESKLLEVFQTALKNDAPQAIEQYFPAALSVTGRDSWYAIKVRPLEQYLLVTFEDVTRQKAVEEHIKQLIFQDELTGIHNRRYFLARAPELLALAQREAWSCGLLYFDLNGFKAVNDSYGHHIGDKVLKAVGWRLSAVSREGDIFFRSGGDEFAFFLPNSSDQAALAAARRVAGELKRPFKIEGANHRVGASIGVAVMLSEEATVDSLLERADAAMYAAKDLKNEDAYAVRLWSPELGRV